MVTARLLDRGTARDLEIFFFAVSLFLQRTCSRFRSKHLGVTRLAKQNDSGRISRQ
jgi:hypothetical protein